jgi:hypothetical protein
MHILHATCVAGATGKLQPSIVIDAAIACQDQETHSLNATCEHGQQNWTQLLQFPADKATVVSGAHNLGKVPRHLAALLMKIEEPREEHAHNEGGQADGNDDGLAGEGGEVGGQLEVAAVVGQQHAVAHGRQRLNALNKSILLNAMVRRPVQQIPALRPTPTCCS